MQKGYVAAVDIGSSNIKALVVKKKHKSFELINKININYRSFDYQKYYDIDTEREIYYKYFDTILENLGNIEAKLPKKTEIKLTFNSLFSNIYLKSYNSKNLKHAQSIADFYKNKLESEQYKSDKKIISFDKQNQKAEAIIFNYDRTVMTNFKSIVDNLNRKPVSVEFDALALANAVYKKDPHKSILLIDLGALKTTYIYHKDEIIEDLDIIPKGAIHLFQAVAKKYNISIDSAKERLLSGTLTHRHWDIILPEIAKKVLKILKRDKEVRVYLSGSIVGNSIFKHFLQNMIRKSVSVFKPFHDDSNDFKYSCRYTTCYGLI